MTTAYQLLEELQKIGVAVKVEGGNLLVKDRDNRVPPSLRQKLKKNKTGVIRQVIVNQVAANGGDICGPLTNKEFTARLTILNQACRDGFINDTTRDDGLTFLLDNWTPESQR